MDVLPGRSDGRTSVCDFTFNLTVSAAVDPAHLTVRFDNVYLVNQLTFDGYLPETGVESPHDADRENSPFCYKVLLAQLHM